jgi:NAD(P)-dependent dehydrogenase (short-subunit alcohol dehydrogenase family)
MKLDLAGKTAIVTGGSAGIGLACAKALFSEGVGVVIAARQAQRLEEAARAVRESRREIDGGEVFTAAADLTDAGDIQRLVDTALQRRGRIDILVNCAGAARAGVFADLDDDAYRQAWTLKLLGAVRMVRAVLPHMAGQRDGRIVNIVGAAGRTPTPTFLAGSTVNAALINFTRGIAAELARSNIRINAVSPAMTLTERADRLIRQTAEAKGIPVEQEKAEAVRRLPLGRLIEPADVAALVLFLASNRAAAITGAEILVDGGQTPGM